jgi:hypothetical protein
MEPVYTVKKVHPQNVRFQNVRFQNVRFQNVRFQNVRFKKAENNKTIPRRVWLVTYRLGTVKPLTFFTVYWANVGDFNVSEYECSRRDQIAAMVQKADFLTENSFSHHLLEFLN